MVFFLWEAIKSIYFITNNCFIGEIKMQNNKPKLLWISYCVPYDCVSHAGGKNHNFYLKGLHKSGDFNIKLISFARKEDLSKLDLDKTGIDYELMMHHETGIKHFLWASIYKISKWNIFDKSGGFVSIYVKKELKKKIRQLCAAGYKPDLIILQWTQVILMEQYIEKLFKGIPIIAIEEDVSYLALKRRLDREQNKFKILLRKRLYLNLKKKEQQCLNQSNLIILSNYKDYQLIRKDGVTSKSWVWSPYYQSLLHLQYQGKTKDILFYGAMSRDENWKSAIWFIENVLNNIENKDVKFVVVGSKPNKKLLTYASKNVIICGFVDDISPYMQNSLCLAAPLVLGAGIKIKILEALSAGIPVLTNEIGIEGIHAIDNKEYYHCTTPEEYVDTINQLLSGKKDIKSLSQHAKLFIKNQFNCEKSLYEFRQQLKDITYLGRNNDENKNNMETESNFI